MRKSRPSPAQVGANVARLRARREALADKQEHLFAPVTWTTPVRGEGAASRATTYVVRSVPSPSGTNDPIVGHMAGIFSGYDSSQKRLRFQTQHPGDPVAVAMRALAHSSPSQVVLMAARADDPETAIGIAQVRGASWAEQDKIYRRSVQQAKDRRRKSLEAREKAWIAALEQRSDRPIQRSSMSPTEIRRRYHQELISARRNRRAGREVAEVTLDVHSGIQGGGVGTLLARHALQAAAAIPGVRVGEFVIDRSNRRMISAAARVGASRVTCDDDQWIYQAPVVSRPQRSVRNQQS